MRPMTETSRPLLTPADTYEQVYDSFTPQIPRRYNMAEDVCDRHATVPGKTALIWFDDQGREQRLSFANVKSAANSLANALEAHGFGFGDRLAILLPQRPETAICHVAAWKMGAISLPLFTLFGEEALEYRLANAGAKVLVTDQANVAKIAALRERLPELKIVIGVDADQPGDGFDQAFWPLVEDARSEYRNQPTAADDPALLIYTSGTTGQPKGALHAHRTMLAHMSSMEYYAHFFPKPGDLFWSPADWAWIGGLMDNIMPAWFHGVPVLAFRARKFDPEEAFSMLAAHRVRNAFIPPTALKMMRQVPDPKRFGAALRTIFSGGEAMGAELLNWGYETFDLVISEGYGQTEFNLAAGNCPPIMDVHPGSMGRPCPGRIVDILNDDGERCSDGETGHIAFKTPDPIAMLGYWRNEAATKEKYVGEWMISGDLGQRDERGYLWFMGRADDVITSAGYRIGPGEIEDCLMKHPAVAMAAAVGVPDPVRTEAVKAFIVPADGVTVTNDLAIDVQDYVKARLSAHEYPRQIEFVDSLPMTATGKIRRRDLRDRERQEADDS